MDRRNFLKNSCTLCVAATGLVALSTFLESCSSINVFNATSENNSIRIPFSELNEKTSLIVKQKNSETDIALIKTKTGDWKALLMLCTHASNPVVFFGNGFRCNFHFSEFNLDGIPQSGPAQKPLKLLRTETKSDNVIIHLS